MDKNHMFGVKKIYLGQNLGKWGFFFRFCKLNIFKASALWADGFYKWKYPSLCLCVHF